MRTSFGAHGIARIKVTAPEIYANELPGKYQRIFLYDDEGYEVSNIVIHQRIEADSLPAFDGAYHPAEEAA
jgi:hypothetical protein